VGVFANGLASPLEERAFYEQNDRRLFLTERSQQFSNPAI
jgi:hypothetical protein